MRATTTARTRARAIARAGGARKRARDARGARGTAGAARARAGGARGVGTRARDGFGTRAETRGGVARAMDDGDARETTRGDGEANAMDAAAAAAAAMREESEEAETAETAEREPSTDDDDETEEEMEAREREEKSERNKVSRRVFGAETDTRATTWTRSLFMLGAIFVFLAAYPKFVGWLCSYFEPLDTAVSAYEALTSNVGLDLRIMRATSTATFKVVALCAVITGLMREGKLPLETPVVVSKLAFNVMLPAYLCTRVAATLYLSPLTKALAILPISAMAQVIFGSIIGVGVTYFVNRFHAYASSHTREEEDLDEEEEIKLEREKRDMSRLGIAACSFGNTFTLPLVFLTEVLGRARADETAGYIALYLIGWTPVLWTVGFLLIAGPVAVAGLSKDGEKKDALRDAFLTAKATMARIGKELLNPPLLGIIAGVLIGATPLKEIFVGNFADATTEFPAVLTFISVIFRALFELAASIGAAALPGQMLVLASSLVKITPEDVEKRIARAKKAKERSVPVDDDEMEENAKKRKKKSLFVTVLDVFFGSFAGAFALVMRPLRKIRAGWNYLTRLDSPDMLALVSACLVRFVFLPGACLFGLLFLRALNSPWFPSDRSAALVLLTMSCMPAAQNLVLLTQLRDATRPLATRLAALMLRQYVFAIIPVTFWLTAFTSAVV
jgi:predicted permease